MCVGVGEALESELNGIQSEVNDIIQTLRTSASGEQPVVAKVDVISFL